MDPTRIRREAVEGDGALKMIREVFSKSLLPFL